MRHLGKAYHVCRKARTNGHQDVPIGQPDPSDEEPHAHESDAISSNCIGSAQCTELADAALQGVEPSVQGRQAQERHGERPDRREAGNPGESMHQS